MEVPIELGNVGPTKDLIAQSFIISGGSNEAHALFIRGLALHLKLEPNEVSKTLRIAAEDLDKDDVRELMKQMGSYHSGNDNAKQRTGETLRVFKKFDTGVIIAALIPSDQTAFRLFLANEDKYDQTIIDKALIKTWETSDKTQRYSDLKAINAELGLYNNLEWWKKMPDKEKQLMKTRGEILLR